MSDWINKNFDIDLWIKLAANDPFKFQIQRHQWLEDTIEQAKLESQPRLKGILWELNMDLEIARNKFNNSKRLGTRVVTHLEDFRNIISGNLPFLNAYPAIIFDFTKELDRT